ncbi:MAG: DUF3365 domain-containing protein [Chitinophagaceae bacterium]|nr:DUF3365 domain-containing protein [Chitinophagaceae bacterium]MCW5927253.1 DUF3365 domain-containing protein [Chitinophagaceae bacterium]
MTKTVLLSLIAGFVVMGCNNIATTTDSRNIEDSVYLRKGDSIATLVQGVLLKNVANATQQHGIKGAVTFCNEKALYLTDSAGGEYSVQRLSDNNRNPGNGIKSASDSAAWRHLKAILKDSTVLQKHFVREVDNDIFYYKAITIAMPACLNCHGSKEKDILPETLLAINEKYPLDKATGYGMGDFRGMWKIKMND